MTTNSPPIEGEIWRSKLGTNYSKDYIEKNEKELLRRMNAIRHLPENQHCADCLDSATVWASVNLGVFLCLECGAHHRSLGTHISRPKGCTGTYLWGPDEIEHMQEIGNKRAAQELYGSYIPSGITKKDGQKWENYLVDKYVHKKYAPKHPHTTATSAKHPTSPSSPRTIMDGKKKHTYLQHDRHHHHHSPGSPIRLPKEASIDLISFDDFDNSSNAHVVPSLPKPQASPPALNGHDSTSSAPATGPEFFAQFGL